jgi:hypothetical protein
MAKARAAPRANPVPPPQAGGKTIVWLIGSLGVFASLAIGLGSPTLLMFMIIGFGPTIAAGLIDKDPERHAAIAVGAMSLAAMVPKVLTQLTAPSSSGYNVLGDPFAWLMVYGAAAIGWGIHAAVPAIFAFISDTRADWRRKDLLKLQESLTQEWGTEVTNKKKIGI